jgi:hypothetical protein
MLKFSQLIEHMKDRSNRFVWDDDDCEGSPNDLEEEVLVEKFPDNDPHREVRAGFKEHARSLKRSHVEELKRYKENQEINHSLRATQKNHAEHYDLEDNEKRRIKKLDHVTSHQTKGHMTVYRGLTKGHMERHNGLKPGTTFTDHGYTSASFHKHIAAKFGNKQKKHIIQIHAPPGTKAHHFDSHRNEHQHEDEVVFHRGTKFRVTHHSFDGEHHIVHAQVVSQRPKAVSKY